MRFFTGLHQPSDAKHFDAAFISVNRLRNRKSGFDVGDWIMDSGAFTEVSGHGRYRHSVSEYAEQVRRWKDNGRMLAAAAQDWMCEDVVLKRAAIADGALRAPEWFDSENTHAYRSLEYVEWAYPCQRDEQILLHQTRTIERYDELIAEVTGAYILPVLQGFHPNEYVRHIRMYGDRLKHGAWVGVGSVCKRNGDISAIEGVLLAVHQERPDLLLHGFGLKTTALSSGLVQELLHTADSMAWSYAARMAGRNANDWREAKAWTSQILMRQIQQPLFSL